MIGTYCIQEIINVLPLKISGIMSFPRLRVGAAIHLWDKLGMCFLKEDHTKGSRLFEQRCVYLTAVTPSK